MRTVARFSPRHSKNPLCTLLGHHLRKGSNTGACIFVEKFNWTTRQYERIDLLWSCCRIGCRVEWIDEIN